MQQPPPPQPPPGGAQYGVPPSDMSPFASPTSAPRQMQLHAEAASPINSRPPPQSYEVLLPGAGAGSFPDDLGGDETDRGGASGNRWPRQETLALLKIRSDMDAVFRDATLKGPLWEEVSRKLAELGYRRSAKKCKEKFENVHKYYKRTKENRAGRQDGKTYRFFSQLEALHGTTPTTPTQSSVPTLPLTSVQMQTQIPVTPTTIGFSAPIAGPSRVVAPVTPIETPQPIMRSIHEIGTSGPPPQGISGSTTPTTAAPTTAGVSFSSNTESSESDESDDEDTEEIGGTREQGKRKRQGGSGGASSKKMMSFFDGLMKQVMERQEAMQQRFLETIEKREQDRMIREEAWRRQEIARLNREQEILAQERAMAASRDAAVVSFIQKITGQTVPIPTIPPPVITAVPPPHQPVPVTVIPQPQKNPPPQHAQSQPSPKTPRQPNSQPLPSKVATPPAVPQPPAQPQPQSQQQPQPQATPQPQQQLQHQHHHQSTNIVVRQQQPPVNSNEMVLSAPETQDHGIDGGFEPGSSSGTSSRWPKAEVHALIKIRSEMDSRYQEAGPKGPLWEEISAGMRRLGYSRSAKRCKEKWENINKYFKKVKESNKTRPEDSKTCPYFHQLNALYRNKYSGAAGGAGGNQLDANTNPNSQDSLTFSGSAHPHGQPQPQPISQHPPAREADHNKNRNGAGKHNTNSTNDNNRNGNGTGGDNGGTGGTQIPTSNGSATTTFYSDPSCMGLKKPEDIMKELMEQRQQHNGYDKFDEGDGSMDDDDDDEYDDDDDDGEDDENGKMQYKIQFQRPNMNVNVSGTSGGNPQSSTAPGTTPGSNSFLAMVK